MQHVLLLQILITLGSAIVLGYIQGDSSIQASLYGGGIAIINALLLAWGVQETKVSKSQNVNTSVIPLYISAVLRFFFTLVGLGVGMGYLKLAPLPLLLTFGLAYLSYPIAARRA